MQPKLSIVIPAYNRAHFLALTLRGLANQSIPPADYEVILVDDGSPGDDLAGAAFPGPAQFTVYRQENAGPAAARNLGVAKSVGDLLVFLDSDMLVKQDFLECHLSQHERTGRALVSGMSRWNYVLTFYLPGLLRVYPGIRKVFEDNGISAPDDSGEFRQVIREDVVDRASYEDFVFDPAWVGRWGFGRIFTEFGSALDGFELPWLAACGGNFSISRSDFDSLGGFDEDLRSYEDWDFGLRFYQSEGTVLFDEKIEVFQQLDLPSADRADSADSAFKKFLRKHPRLSVAILSLLNVPGVGFAELSQVLNEARKLSEGDFNLLEEQVLIFAFSSRTVPDALQLAEQLRLNDVAEFGAISMLIDYLGQMENKEMERWV